MRGLQGVTRIRQLFGLPLIRSNIVTDRIRLARVLAPAVLAAGLVLAGSSPVEAQAVTLTGAGATFPYAIYSKWFSEYATKTGVNINYQSIGSGGGIRQLTEGTVDFGASDAPMSDDEMAKLKVPVIHVPTVLGAVVLSYNLPEVTQPLKLTGAVIADIFMGKITKWNDGKIAALNPGVKLPGSDILVVHRSDGSGTTYIFSDYLSDVSPSWKSGPGKGKELQWPVGIGGKGNEGVAGQVKQTPGSIGYVELVYARQNKLPYALVQNAAGKMIEPTLESVTAAGATANLPPTTDFRVSIVNAPGADAYPIASFTFLLIPTSYANPAKGKALIAFVKWAIHDGQKFAGSLDYSPLPAKVVGMLDQRVTTVNLASAK
jgi:phosphate transport system substrate-binding protein